MSQATDRLWGARFKSGPSAALAALSLHGLLCSYPEMIPFVLLPCALLTDEPLRTRISGWKLAP